MPLHDTCFTRGFHPTKNFRLIRVRRSSARNGLHHHRTGRASCQRTTYLMAASMVKFATTPTICAVRPLRPVLMRASMGAYIYVLSLQDSGIPRDAVKTHPRGQDWFAQTHHGRNSGGKARRARNRAILRTLAETALIRPRSAMGGVTASRCILLLESHMDQLRREPRKCWRPH